MSIPISDCLISKVAQGDEEARKHLDRAMRENWRHGAFTIFACQHEPPCPLTEEQYYAVFKACKERLKP